MPFLAAAPAPPAFMQDITDDEFRLGGSITRTLVFNSIPGPSARQPGQAGQHTINGIQFEDASGHAHVAVLLGAVEEWKVVNSTTLRIDHPLHIHINPFQVTELFDPNERVIDWGQQTVIDRYVFDDTELQDGQCRVNPADPATWKPCSNTKQGFWWDVSRIPAAREVTFTKDGVATSVAIPGYFKMRSRFVDYPGRYVMHCHILIHEDRGMMYSVEVVRPGAPRAHH
jgi:FtsP/CotA-like multicopper oxidase with cupredoxin domain